MSYRCIIDNGIDYSENSDNEYEDVNPLLYIIIPLFFVGIGLLIYPIYLLLGLEKSNAIVPFSVGNYAHAQYMNRINEWEDINNRLRCNRWNIEPCKGQEEREGE